MNVTGSSTGNIGTSSSTSSKDKNTHYLQVIDDVGNFSASDADISALVASSLPTPSSPSYAVIGIMGCQSTGKSTLLNAVFGTHFRMMEGKMGRQQTTKGVWMDRGEQAIQRAYRSSTPTKQQPSATSSLAPSSLIIMDLEGTDSGERGEDRTTFERQTSLFSLSLSSLLILNMWEHDIGRYTASNYGILKTIFEVNLALFAPQSRTIIMFIIRDHIENDTPFVSLKEKLSAEVVKIWSEIRKPEAFLHRSIEDIFQFEYYALPHMKLQSEAFKQGIKELQSRFMNDKDPYYLFTNRSSSSNMPIGKHSVPAESFGIYCHNIWETIKNNKDLNLPTQKEMLATYRCDEIINTSIQTLLQQETFKSLLLQAKERYIETYGNTIYQLIKDILIEYDKLTVHYHKEIVAKKRIDLCIKLIELLEESYNLQLTYIINDVYQIFQSSLTKQLTTALQQQKRHPSASNEESDIPDNFYQMVDNAKEEALKQYNTYIQSLSLITDILPTSTSSVASPSSAGSSSASTPSGASSPATPTSSASTTSTSPPSTFSTMISNSQGTLLEKMNEFTNKERTKLLNKMNNILENRIKKQLTPVITSIMKAGDADMWSQIATAYNTVYHNIDKYLQHKAMVYHLSPIELSTYHHHIHSIASLHICLLQEQHCSMILLHMRKKFDRLFRYDEEGYIRKWKANDDIRSKFRTCQSEALQLLDRFATFRLKESLKEQSINDYSTAITDTDTNEDNKENEDNSDIVIINNEKRHEIELEFPGEIEGALREAESEQERLRASQRIPLWGLALIAFLGFDEFLTVLKNPLLLLLTVIIGGAIYLCYSMGLIGPIINMILKYIEQGLIALHNMGINVDMIRQMLGIQTDIETQHGTANISTTAGRAGRRIQQEGEDGIELSTSTSMKQTSSNSNSNNASIDDGQQRSNRPSVGADSVRKSRSKKVE